jgi:exosortase A
MLLQSETPLARQSHESQAQRRAFAVATAVLLVVFLLAWYADTTWSIVSIWYRSETYAHGFIVVPIVIWLIWRDRAQLATVPVRPVPWTTVALAIAGLGWLVAELASVVGGSQFMLVAMIPLTIWAILGTAMVRALAFPLGFLFFAVPFGDFIVPALMDWTADFTVMALRATGVPVLREGRNFSIPSGNWSVVEACSGVRYLIASLVVGTLYAYLTYRTMSRRIAFIALAILVPLVANWLRAYMIVMLGHLSGNRIAVGVDHIIYGWVFFGVVMALLFWLAPIWLREAPPPPLPARSPIDVGRGPDRTRVVVVAIAVLAAALPWRPVLPFLESRTSSAPMTLPAIAPAHGWEPEAGAALDFRPDFARPVAETNQVFVRNGARAGVFVAYYRNQTQASELVSQDNKIVNTINTRWTEMRSGWVDAKIGSEPLRVRAAELRHGNVRLEAWQWYWIDGRLTTNEYLAKALLALARLSGRGDDSAAIVVYAPTGDSAVFESPVLRQFAADMGDSIHRSLEKARRQ